MPWHSQAMNPRNELIRVAYEARKSLREIGKEHGISHERVRQVLRAAGVVLRTRGEGVRAKRANSSAD